MKIYRNFKCKTGEIIERYVDRDSKMVTCECGKPANKVLSTPRYMGNSTGKSPARHR